MFADSYTSSADELIQSLLTQSPRLLPTAAHSSQMENRCEGFRNFRISVLKPSAIECVEAVSYE